MNSKLPTHCPSCRADFKGEPIPQKYIDAGYYSNETHFSRVIAITCAQRDRVVLWHCPDCKHEWSRE